MTSDFSYKVQFSNAAVLRFFCMFFLLIFIPQSLLLTPYSFPRALTFPCPLFFLFFFLPCSDGDGLMVSNVILSYDGLQTFINLFYSNLLQAPTLPSVL